jgi:ribonuclease G
VIKSEETVAIEVDRKLRELVKQAGDKAAEAYLIRINPKVTAQFIGENARLLHALEADTGAFFSFEGSEGLPLDHFAVTMEGSRDEVIAAAVPFSDGDEVHVHIVEPHMYEVDDAVAKIDGYIISVQGAGPFVGQKRLVRIEEAGRTSATAVLIDLTEDEQAKLEADKEAEAKRRRRGRRGGRARKKEAAEPVEVPVDAASPEEEDAAVKASTGPAGETESDGEGKPKAKRKPAARKRKPKPAAAAAEEAVEEPAEEAEEDGDDDALDSKPRRRGRRGGRRRSRAKADADAAEVTETTD